MGRGAFGRLSVAGGLAFLALAGCAAPAARVGTCAAGEAKEPGPRQGRLEADAVSPERGPARRDLVAIPAACMTMGSRRGDPDEAPPHEVCVGSFLIDRVEVSNAAYGRCVEAGACDPPQAYPRRPVLALPDHPVVGVGWVDAVRYCEWVGERLPTEAEWELAAAGPEGRLYPWGDERPTCDRAVFAGCPPRSTVPVESYPGGATPEGVLHLSGNAWEWVADWWAPSYYARSPRQDPPGPELGGMRALRGGCWNRRAYHLRAADRDSGVIRLRNDHVGFRCARDPGGDSR